MKYASSGPPESRRSIFSDLLVSILCAIIGWVAGWITCHISNKNHNENNNISISAVSSANEYRMCCEIAHSLQKELMSKEFISQSLKSQNECKDQE